MKKFISILPFVFTVCLLVLFYFKRFFIIKFYPTVMNFLIFTLFFSSIFTKETVIQKIARVMKPNLADIELSYTRKVTYAWCIFLFFNFIFSILTMFMSDKIWLIYNGFISYLLVGIVFIIEYIVRIIFKKRHNLA